MDWHGISELCPPLVFWSLNIELMNIEPFQGACMCDMHWRPGKPNLICFEHFETVVKLMSRLPDCSTDHEAVAIHHPVATTCQFFTLN